MTHSPVHPHPQHTPGKGVWIIQLLQPGGGQAGAVGQIHCTARTLGHTGLVCPSPAPRAQPGEAELMSKAQEVRGLS